MTTPENSYDNWIVGGISVTIGRPLFVFYFCSVVLSSSGLPTASYLLRDSAVSLPRNVFLALTLAARLALLCIRIS